MNAPETLSHLPDWCIEKWVEPLLFLSIVKWSIEMMLEPFSAIVAFFLYIDSHPVDHFKDALSVLGFKLL